MAFDPNGYGEPTGAILALDGSGERLMPLAFGRCSSAAALARIRSASPEALFPGARFPEAALAGLYLYFSCLDESHTVSQGVASAEGSFWHGIMHRQEPDPDNSAYWFRRVGRHPVFPALAARASKIAAGYDVKAWNPWDPFAFIDMCEQARRAPGSAMEKAALEIQRAEWQLLFDYCAKGVSR